MSHTIFSGGFRVAGLPGQVTRAGDMRSTRSRLMGGEKPGPSPNHRALDWSVVFTVGGLCLIVPQDNIVVSNKHN